MVAKKSVKKSSKKSVSKKSKPVVKKPIIVKKDTEAEKKIDHDMDELDKILKKTIKKFNSDFPTRAVADNSE